MALQKRKVLLAVDASEQAEQAFNWYLTTVHRPDNEIVCLHVTELLDGDRNRVTYPTAGSYEEALKKEQAKTKELENKYNGKILENGISGCVRSEGGGTKPGEVICKVADEESVAMIVIGTRCLGKVRRTIMGSVSDYVVHHAHCPVIVCRQ